MKRSGKTTSQAIAIAVSRVKKWAAGGDDVDADTRAKAAKALAEWEKLKGKNKAKDTVKASNSRLEPEVLLLANTVTSFNVDNVRRAWEIQSREAMKSWRAQNPDASYDEGPGYGYVREMWTDHVIVNRGDSDKLYKVDYSVAADGEVTFGKETPVKVQYVAVKGDDMVGAELSDKQLLDMIAATKPCYASATDKVLLSIGQKPSALEMVLSARLRKE